MKKLPAFLLCALLAVPILSGCDVGSSHDTAPPTISASPTVSVSTYPKTLSKAQLCDFESLLNGDNGYGFVLSDYSDIRDVNLNRVLYLGAGLKSPENSDDIVKAAEATFEEAPDCDATVLTGKQIDDFLLDKTGYKLSDMNKPLTWTHVKQPDAYVHFHGDTNKVSITVSDGEEISEGTYSISYTIEGGIYDEAGKQFTGGTVTFKGADASVKFISNKLHA